MTELIYLDNNATTRVAEEVVDAMVPFYRTDYGNPHAIHRLGTQAHDAIENARAQVAELVGTDPEQVIFTSCGTESNALVIRGLIDAQPARRKIVTTAVEHPSVLTLLRALANAGKVELSVVAVDEEGGMDIRAFEEAIDDRTLLVSVMLAQNETGVLHPVAEIAALAHARGALMHIDAVQAAGKIPISTTALGADFLTISGHKFHAPKGIGALTRPRHFALRPLWYGGGQELGLRSGTEPVPSIVGLGAAARLARERIGDSARIARLRDGFESALRAELDGITINGGTRPRLPNTANVSFHGIAADDLVRALDAEGICASAGAACHSGKVEPSPTMKAMGKPLNVAMGAVRFSLSHDTTAEDLERTAEVVVLKARSYSLTS